jgi:hypothetical protein
MSSNAAIIICVIIMGDRIEKNAKNPTFYHIGRSALEIRLGYNRFI